mmetsp:Transcript_63830/g.120915  ORF Transcript_63830/g.120915 Transcript_63830/m.120915 type:complete len:294 (-) Transcript_63830:196-1077(-)
MGSRCSSCLSAFFAVDPRSAAAMTEPGLRQGGVAQRGQAASSRPLEGECHDHSPGNKGSARSARGRRLRPGRSSCIVFALCGIACILDIVCYLPHPVRSMPSAEGEAPSPKEVGLPAAEVRAKYHMRLEAWEQRAKYIRDNLTIRASELPGNSSAACRLAAAAVRERHGARVEARLYGSSAAHFLLIIRDIWHYRSLNPFEPEAMIQKKRQKMTKPGLPHPTSDGVCLEVVEASSRSNKAWDAHAAELAKKDHGYIGETAWLHTKITCCVLLAVYAFEVVLQECRLRRKPCTD